MSWVPIQIFSMLLMSANSILDKRMVRDHEPNPVMYLASFALVGIPTLALGIWLTPWPGFEVAAVGLLSGLIFTAVVLLYYKAISLEEVSRLVPVLKLSAVLKLALLAVFLNDQLSYIQYFAFAFMMLGVAVLGWKADDAQASGRFRISRGMLLMSLVALLQAVGGLLRSHLILEYSPWVLAVWSSMGTVLGTGLLLLSRSRRVDFRQSLKNASRGFRTVLIAEQAARQVTGLLVDFAVYEAGSAALVTVFGGMAATHRDRARGDFS